MYRYTFPVFFLLLSFAACESGSTPQGNPEEQTTLSNVDSLQYLETGREIQSATFTALSGELKAAMQRGGVAEAITYCNLAAMPLTDSLSQLHNARIRRVSERYRNPADAPTEAEAEVLRDFAAAHADGEAVAPRVRSLVDGDIAYYAPIYTGELCLKCHGTPGETIAPADYALIRERYPEDRAIGYKTGDLRGMWSIQFDDRGNE